MLHGKYRAALVNTMMHMPMLIQYIFSGRCRPFGSRCGLVWRLAWLACRPFGLSHSGLLLPFRALHQSHYFLCWYHSKLARWAHLHRQWRGSAPCQSNLRLHYHLWDCLGRRRSKLDPGHRGCLGPRNFRLHVSPAQGSCRGGNS